MRQTSTYPAAIIAALALGACQSAQSSRSVVQTTPQPAAVSRSDEAAMARAKADSVTRPYSEADIDFMKGMIAHHAQAILMAGWAASHDASPAVRTLCGRIINAQRDEIRIMQTWLRDRGQQAPEPNPHGMIMTKNGHEQPMLMPGMLTDAELKQLDATRGPQFDQLFLTGMIKHHQGAVGMVRDLYETRGAGEDELVFKLASDIQIDQTTEINRMEQMLFQMTAAAPGR
jgi:uncharacterized protein (DUF305 family)